MRLMRGIWRALSNRFGLLAHRHQRADVVEQIDEQEHEDDLQEADAQRRAAMSSFPAVAARSPSCRTAAPIWRRRSAGPTIVVARMPISMAARTRHASSAAISSSPKIASAVLLSRRLPSVTMVAGLGTMMPELRKPMKRDEQPDAGRHRRVQLVRNRGQ